MIRIIPLAILAAVLLLMPVSTRAASSCLPDFTSLDAFQDSAAKSFALPLKSKNVSGIFVTHATLEGQWDGNALSLTFRFKFDGVSLPYNIFAVLVVSEQGVLAWHDLTHGCVGPGVGIFPGQSYALPAIKMKTPPKSAWHIVVWGRL